MNRQARRRVTISSRPAPGPVHSRSSTLPRTLASLRSEAKVLGSVDDLEWTGPGAGLEEMVTRLRAWRFMDRIAALKPR